MFFDLDLLRSLISASFRSRAGLDRESRVTAEAKK
jgi:hypothetical protein